MHSKALTSLEESLTEEEKVIKCEIMKWSTIADEAGQRNLVEIWNFPPGGLPNAHQNSGRWSNPTEISIRRCAIVSTYIGVNECFLLLDFHKPFHKSLFQEAFSIKKMIVAWLESDKLLCFARTQASTIEEPNFESGFVGIRNICQENDDSPLPQEPTYIFNKYLWKYRTKIRTSFRDCTPLLLDGEEQIYLQVLYHKTLTKASEKQGASSKSCIADHPLIHVVNINNRLYN